MENYSFGKMVSCRIEFTLDKETEYGPRDEFRMFFHNEEFITQNIYPEGHQPVMHIDKVVEVMKEFVAFYEANVDSPKTRP